MFIQDDPRPNPRPDIQSPKGFVSPRHHQHFTISAGIIRIVVGVNVRANKRDVAIVWGAICTCC